MRNKTYRIIILVFAVIITLVGINSITTEAATAKLAKVTISSVKRTANNKTITIKFKKVSKATGYQIAYKKTTSKKYTTKKTTKTTYKLSVTASADYQIRVRAYRKSGSKIVYGAWSKVKTVKVIAPAKVTISSAARSSDNKTITLQYQKVKNATGYEIAYKKTTAKSYTTKKTTKTTYKLTVTAGAAYNIRVRAYCKSGSKVTYGSWSTVKTVKPAKESDTSANEVSYTPKYSYKLTLLNKYPIYNSTLNFTTAEGSRGVPALLYLETQNPNLGSMDPTYSFTMNTNHTFGADINNGESIMMWGASYDDILCEDTSNYGWSKVKSGRGYVGGFTFKTAGKKTITIYETVNDKQIKVASIDITVKDWDTHVDEFYTQTLNELTVSGKITEDMDGVEKLNIITAWVETNFKYLPSLDGKTAGLWLASHEGSAYDVKEISCYGSTAIMCEFAERLGYKAEWHYAGYLNHYNAAVTINGKEYIFDACPPSGGNIITRFDYLVQ